MKKNKLESSYSASKMQQSMQMETIELIEKNKKVILIEVY
jgi:hypothetical protein